MPAPSDNHHLSAHQMQTRRYVAAMMKLTGRSATALARAAGLTPSTINRFMHRPVSHTLSQRTMLALMTETFLALRHAPKQSLDSEAMSTLSSAVAMYERAILERAPDAEAALAHIKSAGAFASAPSTSAPTNDLPVLLTSTRGVDIKSGNFATAPLNAKRPPFLDNDPHAFAILMHDDSMAPRFDSGDILYVSPAQSLDGEKVDAVVEQSRGGFVVGSLISATPDTIRLSFLSPRRRQAYDRSKLVGVYRIVGVQRLGV